LIQRFYDPQQGELCWRRYQYPPDDTRQICAEQIAVVQQQPTLFTGDVMYNIRYGNQLCH